MIKRDLQKTVLTVLSNMPVVALLGPRQVGKTTLALQLAELVGKETAYLDLGGIIGDILYSSCQEKSG